VTHEADHSQWSRDSLWGVLSAVLAILLTWWPVAAILHIAVLCRFLRGPELAGGYILLAGVPSWAIGLMVAGCRRPRPGHQLERWTVFAVCCLPPLVIAFRLPVLVARFL
jgi:hypothetical protein